MTLNEYKETQDSILVINRIIEHINKEINKLPKDYIKHHLQNVYILGDDFLDYPNNTKNGVFRTFDAIIFKKPFPFFGYKCYIKWGSVFRNDSTGFKTDDIRLYNQNIKLSKLDTLSLEKLTIRLINILNSLLEGTKCK